MIRIKTDALHSREKEMDVKIYEQGAFEGDPSRIILSPNDHL